LAPSKAPSFLPPASSAPINPNLAPDVAARLAAIKEKIANQQARSLNPYLSGSGALPKKEDEGDKKKGGLSTVAAHPLLADLLPGGSRGATPGSDEDRKSDLGKSSGANRRDRFGKTMAPKFTSVQANARLAASASPAPQVAKPAHLVAPSANPYTAASTSALQEEKQDEELERAATRRAKPTLRFIQKGKYVQQAEALRQEAKMEALRARIAEASKKAGLSSEFEVLERNIKVTTSVILAITFGRS
jgi:U4/U6 small nuclear ribonucleoprotein PRP3